MKPRVTLHVGYCQCARCAPERIVNLRPLVRAALAFGPPVLGVLWAAWTMAPGG